MVAQPQITQTMTAEEFDTFALLPENEDRILEFIRGEVYEVPSNPYSSEIGQFVAGEIHIYLKGNRIGHLTGESAGYRVAGERFAPDVAYISNVRQKELAHKGYNPAAPDLAVEVVSDETNKRELKRLTQKIVSYLEAGTTVWVFYSESRTVTVFAPGQPARERTEDDTLDGGAILPGFTLRVREVFPADERS